MAVSNDELSIHQTSSTVNEDIDVAFKAECEISARSKLFKTKYEVPHNCTQTKCSLGELKLENKHFYSDTEQISVTENLLAENTNHKVFSGPVQAELNAAEKFNQETKVRSKENAERVNFEVNDLVSGPENKAIHQSNVTLVTKSKSQESIYRNFESKNTRGHATITTVFPSDTSSLMLEPTSLRTGPVSESKTHETLAVVINNKDFRQYTRMEYLIRKEYGMPLPRLDLQNRGGGDSDVDHLSQILKCFGVDVCTYDDLSSSSIRNLLNEIAQGRVKRGKHRDLRRYDRFILFILTHGEGEWLYGVESFPISINEVLEIFSAENCPILAIRPKVVFSIACRNGNLSLVEYCDNIRLMKNLQQESNLMVIYPTQFGCKSYRCETRGTLFVYLLTESLKAHYQERDLLGIMEVVSAEATRYRQLPECCGHLAEEFHFKLMDGCSFDDITMDKMENAGTAGKTQGD